MYMTAEQLAEKLSENGFYGIDVSPEISLLEYNFMTDGETIVYYYDGSLFIGEVDEDEIKEWAENICGEGLLSSVGVESFDEWHKQDLRVRLLELEIYQGYLNETLHLMGSYTYKPDEVYSYILNLEKE